MSVRARIGVALLAVAGLGALVLISRFDRIGSGLDSDSSEEAYAAARARALPAWVDCVLDGAAKQTGTERWGSLSEKLALDEIVSAEHSCGGLSTSDYDDVREVHDSESGGELHRTARITLRPHDPHGKLLAIDRSKSWHRAKSGVPWILDGAPSPRPT